MKHLKAYLEIVGKFRSAGVTGVHGDEDGAGRIQFELSAFEQERPISRLNTTLNRQNLLRHHGQHLGRKGVTSKIMIPFKIN